MKPFNVAIVASSLLLLAGCGERRIVNYQKTPAEVAIDNKECRHEAALAVPYSGDAFMMILARNEEVEECLKARDYVVVRR